MGVCVDWRRPGLGPTLLLSLLLGSDPTLAQFNSTDTYSLFLGLAFLRCLSVSKNPTRELRLN